MNNDTLSPSTTHSPSPQKVEVLEVMGPMLTKGTLGSAGFDLQSSTRLTIYPNQPPTPIPTGVRVAIPEGHVGLLFARSGLSARGLMVCNGVGVIDSDYRGEIKVLLRLFSSSSLDSHVIQPGDRIAQLLIMKLPDILPVHVTGLNETKRGEGGFGSTGV